MALQMGTLVGKFAIVTGTSRGVAGPFPALYV
jgi:hypothetical protein